MTHNQDDESQDERTVPDERNQDQARTEYQANDQHSDRAQNREQEQEQDRDQHQDPTRTHDGSQDRDSNQAKAGEHAPSEGSRHPVHPDPRSPAENAQLALLAEVSGTPKPGNVDRRRDLDGLRFEHFMAGAVGSGRGLRAAESGVAVGEAFRQGVAGMSLQSAGNTQFGCLLLLTPLVRAASADQLDPDGVTEIVTGTTVADAVEFYRAFEHVDVAVGDPPTDASELDARRGAGAIPAIRSREMSLYDIMELSAGQQPADGNALEWTGQFKRTFDAATKIREGQGPLPERAARAFLRLLAGEPDTLVATEHGMETAETVQQRAGRIENLREAETLAAEFAADGINPGTTADVTAAALFVALERGLEV